MASIKKCIGVDVGASSIKVVEMAFTSAGVEILKAANAEINISPDASRAEIMKETVSALKGLLKANKISTKEAAFCVPGQTVFVRRFHLPKTTEERLDLIINYEARQQIPFPIDKTVVEYQVFPIENSQEVDVFLVALKKDVLYDFMELVNKTGLKPIGISISSLSLYNYHSFDSIPNDKLVEKLSLGKKKKISLKFKFKMPKLKKKAPKEKNKAETPTPEEEILEGEEYEPENVRAYIHIGSNVTDLSIGSIGINPILGFTRSIPIAGNNMTQAIMDKCEIKASAEAERIKKENTIILSMDPVPDDKVNMEASEAVTSVLDRILAELRRSLDYYISQPDGMAVDEIILSGGQSLLPNLATYIEDKLGIPVSPYAGPLGENIKGIKSKDQSMALYPITFGLGLLGLGLAPLNIDFLPAERKVAIKFKRKRGFVMVLAGMVAATVLLGAMCGDHYIATYTLQNVRYQDEIKLNQPKITQITDATKLHNDLKDMYDKLGKGLISERDYPLKMWMQILQAKPSDVLVSSLIIFPDGRAQIDGYTEDQGSAVAFTSNLNAELLEKRKILEDKGARLSNIQTEFHDLFKKEVYKFTINLKNKERHSRIEQTPVPVQTQTGKGAQKKFGGTMGHMGDEYPLFEEGMK
ncbi:pilus assembly protein PilM [Candidatus Sumerlaeota bacterium]|nr:pilus assembly protein PilM [Candidatus Sumerlaeota bacterium]